MKGRAGAKRDTRNQGRPATARPPWVFAAVIVALGLLAYSNSFSGVLFGDDDAAIAQNESIRSLWPLAGPLSPPADTTVAARPIANLTFAINYALAGGTANLRGYHAFNLFLHVLTGLGLFGVVRRTLESPPLRGRFGGASGPLAFTIAAIWIAHPLNTQAVTFLAQRVESLMGFFYVATLYAAIRSAESDFRANRWTAAAIAACALGMATKETMIGAPVMVALWLWTCRPGISLLKAPRTLLLGLAGTMIIAIALGVSGARSGSAGFGVEGWPWWSYLRTQAGVIVHYLRLAFWPHPLVFAYDWLPAPSWMAVLPQIVLLEVLGVATLVALFRRWPIGLLGAWFFLILAPSSSIVPIATEVAAEHRMYLPLAAVIAAIVLTVEAGFRLSGRAIEAGFRFSRSGDEGPPVLAVEKRNPASTLLVVLAIPLAVATYDRNRVYASAEGIAAATVRDRPENALAQLTYGTYLAGQNRFAEAEPHLRAAMSLPLSPFTDESKSRSLGHFYLGLALRGQGRNDDAARELALALAAREDFDRAYPLLAEAQLDQKRPAAAVATLERALARRPDDPALLKRVAWVLATSSDSAVRNAAGAVRYAEHGVAVTDSRDPVALDVLAAALAEVGQFDQAMAALAKAAELVRTGGPAELIPTLREHLALLEARRPIRSPDW